MHKPQKKHNEIRGYVKRVFMPGPSCRFIANKKQRMFINPCFLIIIMSAKVI